MNNDLISSNPSGKITLNNNVIRQNTTITNIQTSNQASSEINQKINNNEFVCNATGDDPTDDDPTDDDPSSTVEGFINYQKKSYIIYSFFLLFIIIGLIYLVNKIRNKK